MQNALIATLAAYGPSTLPAIAGRLNAREGRVRRGLDALWHDDLVSIEAGSWYRLTMRGQQRAAVLRADERGFERLIRTRT